MPLLATLALGAAGSVAAQTAPQEPQPSPPPSEDAAPSQPIPAPPEPGQQRQPPAGPDRSSPPPAPESSLEGSTPPWAPWREEQQPPEPHPELPTLEDPFVPVQVPVPEVPPQAAPSSAPPESQRGKAPPLTYTINERWFDVSHELGRRVSQDAGFAWIPRFGGLAADVISNGAGLPFGSALNVDLDGASLNIPIAARGVNYVDFRLVPIAGLEAYTISPGAFGGGFAGNVALRTRRLQGVEGGLLIGERDTRYISLAGGTTTDQAWATVAFESRLNRGARARTSEDVMSVLAAGGWQPTSNFEVGAHLRYYRGVWDDPGTLTQRLLGCADPNDETCVVERTYSGDDTDGGDLRGTGLGVNLRWALSDLTEATATVSFLEDRFNAYTTPDEEQIESRDYNRVARARAQVRTGEFSRWGLEELAVGGDFEYDNGVSRTFASADRTRLFQTRDLRGDWIKGGGFMRARFVLWDALSFTLEGGVDSLYLRRTEPRLGAAAQTQHLLYPVYRAEIGYHQGQWGVAARLARDNNPAPNAFVGAIGPDLIAPNLAWETDQASLLGYLRLRFDDWNIEGRLSAYGAVYGRPLLVEAADGIDTQISVVGANAALDIEHRPTRLALVARGGPAIGVVDGVGAWGSAPGVPDYALHVGLLRRVTEGFVVETWLSAYGDYGLWGTGPNPVIAPGQQDLSLRVGYQLSKVALWVGASNLLDGAIAAPPDNVIRRQGRTFYGMINIVP